METRTARTPSPSGFGPEEPAGGAPRGFFDDEPVLSSVKVPSDPAQVVVNNASFRVQLAGPAPLSSTLLAPARRAAVSRGAGAGASGGRRRAPVVWSGRTGLEDTGAHRLLQTAVRTAASVPSHERLEAEGAAATTQVLPRLDETAVAPMVVGPRGPQPPETAVRPPTAGGARPGVPLFRDELSPEGPHAPADPGPAPDEPVRRRGDAVRHAYYPGRRMNLGVVLLPLRIFLGFISVYAGMGKLSNPVYFDGGDRGSMVTWLRSLEPWTVAEPLRDVALAHPVGSGLTVAFLQIIVGVLTMFGLWQRLAASVGALLSAALLVTVSWRSLPVYDAPDIIYLAAWSPLIIAGAPVYSADGRLAGEAWRTLGPRVGIWDLRRRVLRRGAVLAAVAAGLSLLLGSLLGGAVRSSQTVVVPGEDETPRNELPGSPLPKEPGRQTAGQGTTASPEADDAPSPSASARDASGAKPGAAATPGQRESTRPVRPTRPQQRTPEPPSGTAGAGTSGGVTSGGGVGTSGGSNGGSATGGGSAGGSTGGATGGGSTGGDSSGGHTGALGGLLG